MQVCARVYATLAKSAAANLAGGQAQGMRAGTPFNVVLADGSTLNDLIAVLGLPEGKVRVAFVNGRVQALGFVLSPGDEVGLFPPIGGG